MDRGTWWAIVQVVSKSWARLNNNHTKVYKSPGVYNNHIEDYILLIKIYFQKTLFVVVITKLCLTLLQPHVLQPTRLLCLWDFQGKNTGVGCHFFLQGIFPTQGSSLCLLHFQACSLLMSPQGSPQNIYSLKNAKWKQDDIRFIILSSSLT